MDICLKNESPVKKRRLGNKSSSQLQVTCSHKCNNQIINDFETL